MLRTRGCEFPGAQGAGGRTGVTLSRAGTAPPGRGSGQWGEPGSLGLCGKRASRWKGLGQAVVAGVPGAGPWQQLSARAAEAEGGVVYKHCL